jgi:hypothetical protein
MTKLFLELKNAITGNYAIRTTQTAGIKPAPYEIAYSVEEMNEVFERGMKGPAQPRAKRTTAP